MNCLRLNVKRKCLVLSKSEIPRVQKDDEMVVKVILAGVCGTDLHIIETKFPAKDGVALGHELIGTVSEVSKNNDRFRVGDFVAINPNLVCGVCFYCRRAQYNFCEGIEPKAIVGIYVDGGFANYCKVHVSSAFKIPPTVKAEQAVLAEPLSCITHSLDLLGDVQVGKRILVVGAGITGLIWASVFHFLGHRNVFVVQRSSGRRTTFNNLDTNYKAMSWDEIADLRKKDPKWCVDLVIDTSGNTDAMEKSVGLLEVGGTLLVFGVADPDKKISISPFDLYKKELTLIGAAINTNISFQNALSLLEAMGDRYFTKERLNMKSFSLAEHETAIKDLENRKYTKILFEM